MMFLSSSFIFTVAVVSSVVAVVKFFIFWRNRKSPFDYDTRYPPTPLELDQAKRNQVLKRPFNEQVATDEQWDVVVIGSGVGGLASAALLGKIGKKVLVLEKHHVCGGACHTFNDKGYEFNIGIHYVGEMGRPSYGKTLLDFVSDGQIQWAPLESETDFVHMNTSSPTSKITHVVPLTPVSKAWQNRLKQQFPEEEKAIDRFFAMLDKIPHLQTSLSMGIVKLYMPLWLVSWCDRLGLLRLSHFYSLNNRTLSQVTRDVTENMELRQLLAYMWVLYGTPPQEVGFSFHASCYNHYKEGGYFPIGGPSEIPYRIVSVIEKNGGSVMMNAPITQILTDSRRRVTGVRVGKDGHSVDIHAPVVISDAGFYNTFMKLLPESVARKAPVWPIVSSAKPGIGLLAVFVGLKGSAKELGFTAQNGGIFTSFNGEEDYDEFTNMTLEEALKHPIPNCCFAPTSAKDPSWETRCPGRSTFIMATYVPYAWFAKWSNLEQKQESNAEYEAVKKAFGQKLIDQVFPLYPGNLKDAIDYVYVSTPAAHECYLNARQGAGYGLDHVRERFDVYQSSVLRPDSGVKGLYMVGQDITMAGLVPSSLSAVMCVSTVLGYDNWLDLHFLMQKDLKKYDACMNNNNNSTKIINKEKGKMQ